ncbi:hypothetical protein SeMB42_g02725 [Synchytrium endobioticum]|uniref:CUE domain-containing protein n=1 Tax=Synchytrium endobioticum TaxID=286115 RepID=A0A507CI24_9FUNG|nr:hypothetical protein SeLEV6574_g07864 [Synchytrium endobioticum]TPX49117.1 hypothetical protein SeMB42_g02725 [Synchytrium endobioticum]
MDAFGAAILAIVFILLLRLFTRSTPLRPQPIPPHSTSHLPAPRPHPVDEQVVHSLASMFPGIPADAIRDDLSRTGNAENTIDNVLNGTIHVAPAPSQGPSAISSTVKELLKLPLPDDVKADWCTTPEEREKHLRNRKAQMLHEARQKFLTKQPQSS